MVTTRILVRSVVLCVATTLAPAALAQDTSELINEVKELRKDNDKLRQEIKDGLDKLVEAVKAIKLPADATPAKSNATPSERPVDADVKQLQAKQDQILELIRQVQATLEDKNVSRDTRAGAKPPETIEPSTGRFRVYNRTLDQQPIYVRTATGNRTLYYVPAASEIVVDVPLGEVEYYLPHETPRRRFVSAPSYEATTEITRPYRWRWDPFRGAWVQR